MLSLRWRMLSCCLSSFGSSCSKQLFVIVALPLRLGKAGVPAVEGRLGDGGRIGEVQRVDDRPVQAVAGSLERVHDDTVDQRILGRDIPFVQEGIDTPETVRNLHRIPRRNRRKGIDLAAGPEKDRIVVPDEHVLDLRPRGRGRTFLLVVLFLPGAAFLSLFRPGFGCRRGRIPLQRIHLQGRDVDAAEQVRRFPPVQGAGARRFREHQPRQGGGQEIFRPQIRHKPIIMQRYTIPD